MLRLSRWGTAHTLIHGLSSDFLRGKPLFIDIAAELIEFVAGAEVVIHNAPFDLAFLNKELLWAGIPTPFENHCAKVTDTLPAFRAAIPEATMFNAGIV